MSRASTVIGEQITGIVNHDPHMTLFGNRYVRRKANSLSNFVLDGIVHPLPEMAGELLTLPVKGVNVFPRDRKELLYTVELDDPEGRFEAEREIYIRRALGRLGLSDEYYRNPPHLTLGSVDEDYAAPGLEKTLEESLPDSLTFRPTSAPRYPTGITAGDAPRMVVPGGIPPGLLRTLRSRERHS